MLYSNRAQWFFLVTFFAIWIVEAAPRYRGPRAVLVLFALAGIAGLALYRQKRGLSALPTPGAADARHHDDGPNEENATPCQTCSEPIPPTARRCKCGTPLVSTAEREEYDGLGGWLGLFVFGLLVANPLSAALSALPDAAASSKERWAALPGMLLIGTTCAYGIFVGVQLIRRTGDALRHARVYLILRLFVWGIWMSLRDRPGEPSNAQILKSWALYGIPLTWVWVAYFRRSRRVLISYGVDALREGVSRRFLLIGIAAVILIVAVPTVMLSCSGPYPLPGATRGRTDHAVMTPRLLPGRTLQGAIPLNFTVQPFAKPRSGTNLRSSLARRWSHEARREFRRAKVAAEASKTSSSHPA